jgi:hypothetical protein
LNLASSQVPTYFVSRPTSGADRAAVQVSHLATRIGKMLEFRVAIMLIDNL